MTKEEMIKRYLNKELISELSAQKLDGLNEIRLRSNQPVVLCFSDSDLVLKTVVKQHEIEAITAKMSEYSPYAFRDELRCGYITLKGGFRVGVCGRAVTSGGELKGIKAITSLNIRVPCRAAGCGERVVAEYKKGFKNTVIISPPGCGKTTLLRDIIYRLSSAGLNVGVCDERGELNCFGDLGLRADILEGFKKRDAAEMLIRGMNPHIIALDELGGKDDLSAVREASYKGVGILATLHGKDLCDDMKGLFKLTVVLKGEKGKGEIERIYDCCD